MKPLLSRLLAGGVLWWLRSYRRGSLDLLKIKAAMWYVRGVGAARQLFMGGVGVLLLVALAVSGFLLLHVGLYALLPRPANAITLMALGALYLVFSLLALRWACAEKTWMTHSKAADCVKRATGKGPPDPA